MNQFKKIARESGIELLMPPPSLTEMKGEFIQWEKDKLLKARFPYDARFINPISSMQGGILAAALDNVWGPLSYTVMAAPCVTLELSTTFISPILPADAWYEVEGLVTARTKNMIFLDGRITIAATSAGGSVTSPERLVAIGKTICLARHKRS